jgi:hypothetical protein
LNRGLGRIQLAILASIESSKQLGMKGTETSINLTAWTLAYNCFEPRLGRLGWTPSRSQIEACTRAMHSFVRKFPQYALTSRRSRQGIVLYEIGDQVTAVWAKMDMETKGNPTIRSEVRAAMAKQNQKEDHA